jgi:hypothetical protein
MPRVEKLYGGESVCKQHFLVGYKIGDEVVGGRTRKKEEGRPIALKIHCDQGGVGWATV